MWRERGSERGRVFELKLLKLLLRLLQCRSESTRLLYPCRVVGRVHRRYFLRRRSSRLRRRRKRRREWGVWEGGRELRLQSRRRRRRRSRRRRLVSCEPSCVWAFQRLLVEPLREENVGGRDSPVEKLTQLSLPRSLRSLRWRRKGRKKTAKGRT